MATVDPGLTVEIEAQELRAGDILVTRTRSGRELERPLTFVHHDKVHRATTYTDSATGEDAQWRIPFDWPLRIRPRT